MFAGDSVVHRPTVPPLDESVVADKLSGQIVYMHSPEVLSSTAVMISWEVRRNRDFVEGFRIKYRIAAGQLSHVERCLRCVMCSVTSVLTVSQFTLLFPFLLLLSSVFSFIS